jgi:hypothetical protein
MDIIRYNNNNLVDWNNIVKEDFDNQTIVSLLRELNEMLANNVS